MASKRLRPEGGARDSHLSRAAFGAQELFGSLSGGSAALHHRLISLKPPAWHLTADSSLTRFQLVILTAIVSEPFQLFTG
jgi:hypothetical protein